MKGERLRDSDSRRTLGAIACFRNAARSVDEPIGLANFHDTVAKGRARRSDGASISSQSERSVGACFGERSLRHPDRSGTLAARCAHELWYFLRVTGMSTTAAGVGPPGSSLRVLIERANHAGR